MQMYKICIFDLSDDENAISEAEQEEDVQKIACQGKVKAQKGTLQEETTTEEEASPIIGKKA